MSMPKDIGIVDTMIGFPADDFAMYDFIREQLKDPSAKFEFPVEYMFKQVPKELYGSSKDPVTLTLNEMDKHGVEIGLIGVGGEVSRKALTEHPDRFVGQGSVDPNTGMEGIREMVRQYEAFGVSSFGAFNAGFNPQVGINDAKMYPIYAKCVELDVPIFSCVGVPGPRFPMWPQKVELIDQVPEEHRRKILGLNAAEVYNFDVEKLLPLAKQFGPTPQQVNQALRKEDIPRDSMCYLFQNALHR